MTQTPFAVRPDFLPFSPPDVGPEEIAAVVETLRSPWITTGPRTKDFEREFAESVGAEGALALNSCTAGLHIALASLGIGPGDEVITTPMTFCASCNVIEHVGARPVLVDIDPRTMLLDLDRVKAAITPRTKAILPVHFAGMAVDMDALEDMVEGTEIEIVEDAAHCLPSSVRGRSVGSRPNFASFSFYATKNLTTAEGGMLTGSKERLDKARVLGLHGMSRDAFKRYEKGGSWRYEVVAPGFKYNMTDIQAALGRVQLRRLGEFARRRREIVALYDEAFGAMPALETPAHTPLGDHAWHLYVLRLNLDRLGIDRDRFIEELSARNIGTSVHFIPIHLHPYYRDKYGFAPEDLPNASGQFERTISLPLSNALSTDDARTVVDAVRDVIERFAV